MSRNAFNGNMARAGDSNWMPNVAPWRAGILAILAKMAIWMAKISKKRQRADNSNRMRKAAPWRAAIFAKMVNLYKRRIWNTLPLESGDFDENGNICQKAGDLNWIANVAP